MNKMKSTKTKMTSGFIISIVGIFFLVACCTSCGETEREELQILIQNRTDSPIHISLYPNDKYLTPLDGFVATDVGGGGRDTEFSLSPNEGNRYVWGEVVFTSSDLSIKPYILASKVFDSIHISTENIDKVIKFTHETVTGYSENIFSENSTWDFKIIERNEQTQFRKNPVKSYCYKFLILKDKIIIE